MHPLSARRARRGGGPLVLDGALATEVERRGGSTAGVLWSARALVEAPALVRDIHRDYLLAGADVVCTATYQAAWPTLIDAGLDAAAVLAAGVRLAREAREAAGADALVAASMGPYGAHLADGSEYRGDYAVSSAALIDFHQRQLEALWSAGPDLLAFETIPSAREAEAIAEALARAGGPPAWVSFSVRDAAHVAAGDALAPAARAAAAAVGAVGVNCAAQPVLLAALAHLSGDERLIYPNSGEVWSAEARAWRGDGVPMGDLGHAACAAGATMIGGCCRTTPDDVRALAEALVDRRAV